MARKVHDKALLRLIGKYLRVGALVGQSLQPTETGVPQGSPRSPLLSNVMGRLFGHGGTVFSITP